MELLLKAFQYDFFQKALICGAFIAISSSLLGIFLVLRRLSLIGDGLSHISFASISLSLFLGISPILFSIPVIIIFSLLLHRLIEKKYINSDAGIGLLSATSIAIGVLVISLTKGFNIDIYSYLFGSILSISWSEVFISIIVSIVVILCIILLFNELFLITYDEDYAKISGINIKFINMIFNIIQSVTIVIGIRIVGAMLISSLIIFPAITSLQLAKSFRTTIFFALLISIFSVISGILLSFLINTPTGATIVIINFILFVILFTINRIFNIK